jgi:lipoate-protein ligase A
VRLDVQEGRIAGARFFGDFMGREDVGALEARLVGLAYDRASVETALRDVRVSDFFGDVAGAEVLDLVAP